MKQGQESFQKLWEKLEAERAGMKDYIANTQMLSFSTDENGTSQLHMVEPDNTIDQMGVTELAHRQMAARLKIPFKYYEMMRTEQPALLDTNVNTWLHEQPENRMVRTLHGNVRAFLSDRYQRLDNLELAHRVLKVLGENPLWAVGSCEVTETYLYIKVVSEKLKAELGELTAEGSSGGRMVTIKLNGHFEMLEIKLDPICVDNRDVQMLEDLIVAAHNNAMENIQAKIKEKTASLLGGMDLSQFGL